MKCRFAEITAILAPWRLCANPLHFLLYRTSNQESDDGQSSWRFHLV